MAIRMAKLEVAKFGDGTPRSKRWLEIADACQAIKNRIWRQWLIWHEQHGTQQEVSEYQSQWVATIKENQRRREAIKKWKKDKFGPKPPNELAKPKAPECCPSQFAKDMRSVLTNKHPDVHSRIIDLLTQTETKLIKNKPSSNGGAWPAWMMILLDKQGPPSYCNPQPIPFDRRNSEIVEPLGLTGKDDDYMLSLRLRRCDKEGSSNKCSITENVFLKSKGRKFWKQRTIIQRIVEGEKVLESWREQCQHIKDRFKKRTGIAYAKAKKEDRPELPEKPTDIYEFKGSRLFFDGRKWYAHISYELPDREAVGIVPNRIAYLHAGRLKEESNRRNTPWILRYDGRSHKRGGSGLDIGGMRRRIFMHRAETREHYRRAANASKGHGRSRAIRHSKQLEDRWRGFSKRRNNQLSRDIVNELITNGIGTLVYIQPSGNAKTTRFICMTGSSKHSADWPHDQLGHMLNNKASIEGITVKIEKSGCVRNVKSPLAKK